MKNWRLVICVILIGLIQLFVSGLVSESWIYAIIFVMNILKLSKDFLCQYFLDFIRGIMNLKFSISIEIIKNQTVPFHEI